MDDFRRQCRDVLEDWTRPVGEVPGEMPCDIPLHELFLLIIAAVLGTCGNELPAYPHFALWPQFAHMVH